MRTTNSGRLLPTRGKSWPDANREILKGLEAILEPIEPATALAMIEAELEKRRAEGKVRAKSARETA